MEEKENEYMLKIELELYTQVMLLIESQYNLEGVIDVNKKDSTRIIFKDKQKYIKKVADLISEFSEQNNLDKDIVKDYLLKIISNKMELNNDFKEEYKEAEDIIIADDEER